MTQQQHQDPMTAICIHEYMFEWAFVPVHPSEETKEASDTIQSFWKALLEDVGAYEFRQIAINMAPAFDEAFEVFDGDFQGAFDYEFIPALLDHAVLNDSKGFMYWSGYQWGELAREIFPDRIPKRVPVSQEYVVLVLNCDSNEKILCRSVGTSEADAGQQALAYLKEQGFEEVGYLEAFLADDIEQAVA